MSVPKISIRKMERAGPELFEVEQPRLELVAPYKITCRVCERVGDQIVNGVLICVECGADTQGLREHIKNAVAMHYARIEETWGALEQQVEAADEGLLARWNAFQDAVTKGAPEAGQAERAARNDMPGPLANLIRLWCAWRDAMGVYTERKNWGDRAGLALDLLEEDML